MASVLEKRSAKGLLVFRYNLRIHDNTALRTIRQCVEALDCVFIMDSAWSESGEAGLPFRHGYRAKMGAHRRHFIQQALLDLQGQLERRGSSLVLLQGRFLETLATVVRDGGYGHVALVDHPGHYEGQQIRQLQKLFPDTRWICTGEFTLFERGALPFAEAELPASFSRFRKQVESLVPVLPVDVIGALPPATDYGLRLQRDDQSLWQTMAAESSACDDVRDSSTAHMIGGESAALEHLNRYIHLTSAIRHYKETRNQLQGWDFSSKLSPWLAQGCLSPRMVWHEVLRHEQRYGRNDSTGWLLFELLWREYFQWMARCYGARMFRLRGIQDVNPLLTFYPEAFMAWREGNTPSAFVNAFMRQLKSTGWMSNRGRQIVASYLVNELGVDWRYGAAWFEEMLVDYDCAANWGNWQYLAGVGADPRGRRRFNIEKQQAQYDPEGEFVTAWAGNDDAQYLASFLR